MVKKGNPSGKDQAPFKGEKGPNRKVPKSPKSGKRKKTGEIFQRENPPTY